MLRARDTDGAAADPAAIDDSHAAFVYRLSQSGAPALGAEL